MGILTDPSLSQRNQIGRSLVKHNQKICIVLYLAGIVWFCMLGSTDFNHATYFSENALSPGLVYSEIKSESAKYAQTLLEELNREREVHKSRIPYSWLLAKMKQIGLETFTHNFTLNYPLGSGRVFHGKSVYGILRAPRIGSTEGIVFSTPYRPPNSVHTDVTPGIPILLAFAEFARKKNYWAKDLIFLITDQEQLGMHAWLEAYYKEGIDGNCVLEAGNLEGRAGALQAALNIEIQDFDTEYINVKIEGLNGQLPNLDMFNLVQRLAIKENLPCGYKQTSTKKRSASHTTVKENILHMLSMIFSQASGIPTGNHGLFHRYRIESLTLEGVKKQSSNHQGKNFGVVAILRTIEGISRSLNNLLERFHQSYFFYLLVANDRFVSIGDFIACLLLMAGALFIKAFFLWLSLDSEEKKPEESEEDETVKVDMQYFSVGSIFAISSLLGIIASFLPLNKFLNESLASNGVSTEIIVTSAVIFTSLPGFIFPVFFKLNSYGKELLHIGSLLYLGCALVVVGLLNFSLGFILGTLVTPLAILLNTKHGGGLKIFSVIYTFLLHPLITTYCFVFVFTLNSFKELSLLEVACKAGVAFMDALTFSVVDSIIYSNWLYTTATAVFFPAWILLWSVCLIQKTDEIPKRLKTD